MERKPLKKLMAYLATSVMAAALIVPNCGFATSNQASSDKPLTAKARVSVHDPSIVKDTKTNTYYVFGSHIEAARSKDLRNWTKFTNSYTTPNNVIYGDLSKNLANSFAWAGENDSDSKGGYSVWAPDVFYNKDYVNSDGKKGAYMIYYCTSSTYIRSAIGYAVSQKIEGPYTYVDTIMYSGFTKGDGYDSNSKINKNYNNTNLKTLIEKNTIPEVSTNWFNADGSFNNSYAPNAIDPNVFYDGRGKLWMAYGSWSGGIYLLQIDAKTGKAIYPGKDTTTSNGKLTDRYFGVRIAGGYTQSGEGPYIVYDKDNGYYYLYVTYAGLAANGGYNMRMFRSKNVDGPYLDAAGKTATLPGNVDNTAYGIKLIGNYQFDCQSVGYKAGGHNSSFIDSDGKMYLVYHTRFNGGTEEHQVRVHQMLMNADNWPVVAPYEYSGDHINNGYYKDVTGYYEFINHGTSSSPYMIASKTIKLNKDNTITGDVTGTWTRDKNYVTIKIGNATYKGVFFEQQDESGYVHKVMTFSAVGNNNVSIWGSRIDAADSAQVKYAANMLVKAVPTVTKNDIVLPTVGACDTKVSWSSSNPSVVDTSGKVNRTSEDVKVTLTATVTKGKATYSIQIAVTVLGKLSSVGVTPILKYDFGTVNGTSVVNTGSKQGDNATLVGTAAVVQDASRGSVLSIKNAPENKKVNYLALPTNTFDGITSSGYTVGMWVNMDKVDANRWVSRGQHSALFEARPEADMYPMTRLSENLWGRINANGAWADATTISTPLTEKTWQYVTFTVNSKGIVVYLNGVQVGAAAGDLVNCFTNNFLAAMKDVRVGSGNVWNDEDVEAALIDDVALYNVALTEKQAEALYNEAVSK